MNCLEKAGLNYPLKINLSANCMKMALPKSRVNSNSLQNPDSIEIKRFDIKIVTGSTAITSISFDAAGIKAKLNIEKMKMTKKTW